MPLTFVTYSRVSTRSQSDSWSPITQLQSCHEFGISQGWKPYKKEPHIHDTQTGVSYEERQGIQRVLELVKAGLVQRVIINDIDRAGRDGDKLKLFISDIYETKGARPIISLDSREFPTADEFIYAYDFQIAVAEHNRRKIIIDTRRGMKTAFKAGAYLTAPPFGYERYKTVQIISNMKVSVTKLKINPKQSDLVKKGLEFFSESQSYRQASIMLNKYNLKQNPDERHSFISASISRMVENLDAYLGLPYVVKRVIDKESLIQTQQHDAIIDQALAERVRKADKLRNRDTVKVTPKPFRRLIMCSHCGSVIKVCTKHPGKSRRVEDYHYTVCFSYATDRMNKRVGMPHLIKNTGCRAEISASKFISHLESFLTTLDNNLFKSRLEEIIVSRITDVRTIAYSIENLEIDRDETTNEMQEIENEILNYSGKDLGRVIAIFERKLENLEDRLELIRESIQDKAELYAREVSSLSSMGINREKLESVEFETDSETMEVAKVFAKAAKREINSQELDMKELERLVIEAGQFAQNRESEINSGFFRELARTQALKVGEMLVTLKTALDAEDWITVNDTMASIGLGFTADYSETDRLKRVDDIRLTMHGEISPPYSNSLLSGSLWGNDAGPDPYPAGIR
ncbi:recombinase family protein [Deinococcus arenicola]|uniref:Recombinase family protein n=1 Tax=Deinococcus arenicola TaxID=2994950 RepID=A0ABU4DM85_9DEIO|nr:recombinase family protein [Deinococcus sp. ZS9-10]MDV6373214.1 recombinase family protein [Deinococcus sp. ZS9-10]